MKIVLLPMTCDHCGSPLTLGCEEAGLVYLSQGWFRRPECREVNKRPFLPGDPVTVERRVEAAL